MSTPDRPSQEPGQSWPSAPSYGAAGPTHPVGGSGEPAGAPGHPGGPTGNTGYPGGPTGNTGYPAGLGGNSGYSAVGLTDEERNWAMAAHLSSVLGIWIGFLGALGPLIVLLVKGDRSPFIRSQAVEALNFNISVLLYSIVGWILAFILIGFVLLGLLFVFWLVLTIVATVKVSNGEHYRYPLTIRLVH
ncbi:MAG TPA: DUF4870 domain-containing protein [Pseudonocardia sp.]